MNPSKYFLAAVVPLAVAGSGAASADNGPGCGFGQQLFEGKTGLFNHVLAATTNGSSYNQLFGLSFDSLGCNAESVITVAFQQDVFVAQNLDNLARDAAAGGGDYLDSLAALMEMDSDDAAAFAALAQRKYDTLFGTPSADSDVWLDRLSAVLESDAQLAPYAATTRRS